MVVISRERFENGGTGSIQFSSLSGGVNLDLIGEISADLISMVAAEDDRTIFTINISPFLQITSSLEDKPFFGTPEARYKFGSYSIIGGTSITFDDDDNFSTDYYLYSPQFIVYPLQRLEEFRLQMKFPNPSVFDYEVVQQDFTGTPTIAEVVDARKFETGFIRDKTGIGIQLNLNEGYEADIKFSYTCVQIAYGFTFTPNIIAVVQ